MCVNQILDPGMMLVAFVRKYLAYCSNGVHGITWPGAASNNFGLTSFFAFWNIYFCLTTLHRNVTNIILEE